MTTLIINGTPRTFVEKSHAIRVIKGLIRDGVPFEVSYEARISELPKLYGFMSDDKASFLERVSVQKVSDDMALWTCRQWQVHNNKLSNPVTIIVPSMMVTKYKSRKQVFYWNSKEISSRRLTVHAFVSVED